MHARKIMIQNYFLKHVAGIKREGFILPFTMLISTLILFVVMSSMTLLSKQLYFSKLYKQSQVAYYAADDALFCAITIDDTYVGDDGLGIFPSFSAQDPAGEDSLLYMDSTLSQLKVRDPVFANVADLMDIKCAQAVIFDQAPSSASKFTIDPVNYIYHFIRSSDGQPDTEEGKSVSFFMKMQIENNLYRCSKITVNKTASFRQIISQGYSSCDSNGGAVERAVVNETIAQ